MTPTDLDSLPRVAVSVERTINLGNYESAKIFLSVSNLHALTTAQEVADAIDFQGSVYEDLKARVTELARTKRTEKVSN